MNLHNTTQTALNFSEYFSKIASLLEELGKLAPIYSELNELLSDSPDLQDSISEFYAITTQICSRAIRFFQKKGKYRFSTSESVISFSSIRRVLPISCLYTYYCTITLMFR